MKKINFLLFIVLAIIIHYLSPVLVIILYPLVALVLSVLNFGEGAIIAMIFIIPILVLLSSVLVSWYLEVIILKLVERNKIYLLSIILINGLLLMVDVKWGVLILVYNSYSAILDFISKVTV